MSRPRGVRIGAQVGYRDLAGFGRRFIDVSPKDLTAGFAARHRIAIAPAPEYTDAGNLKSRSLAYALHRDGLRKKALDAIIPLYRQRKTREEIAAMLRPICVVADIGVA